MDVPPIYRSAVRQFGLRLAKVDRSTAAASRQSAEWAAPTPAGWTVAELVAHVVDGQRDVPRVLAGSAPLPPSEPMRGTDAAAGWQEASTAAVAALAAPMDRPVRDRDGRTLTEIEYGRRMAVELTVHAWDLARATGQSPGAVGEFPNDLISTLLAWTEESDSWRRRDGYAVPIPVPGCTDDLIELLALTGRNRWWRPDPS